MYKALFRIQSPSTVHYESILREDIARLPGFRKIGINPLSHAFLVAYEAEAFEPSFLLRLLEEKGIFCTLEWVIEDNFYKTSSLALVRLRSAGCRILSLIGVSLFQAILVGSQEVSLGLAFLGLGDLYWTMYQIRLSGCLPELVQRQMKWLTFYASLCLALRVGGEVVFPHLLFIHFLLTIASASVLLHTDLISKITHQQDLDHLWAQVKVIRNGIHDLIEIPIDTIVGGEFVLVQVGDLFPADGTITSGATLVDDSWLDGKTYSCAKYEGDQVLSGSRNLTASVLVLTTCSRKLSLFSRIHDNLIPLDSRKAPTREFTFSIMPFLLGIVLTCCFEFLLFNILQFPRPSLGLALSRVIHGFPFLGFLGLAFTDALTRRQILEEHPEIYVPKLFLFSEPIRHIIFKKEFLTRKRYILSDLLTLPSAVSIELTFHSSFSKGAVLLIASSIQRHANLELAQALFDVYIPNSTQKKPKEAIEIVSSMLSFSNIDPGKGIETCFRGSQILMGLPDWIAQKGKTDLSMIRDWIDTCLIKGEHVEVMSLEGAIIAAFSFAEECLPNTLSILQSIQRANCQSILCTEHIKSPFIDEIRRFTELEVMHPEEIGSFIHKSGKRVACIERPLSPMPLEPSYLEICTLKERTGDAIPIQIVPQKEEHVGVALLLINQYIRIRNLNILLSYLWSAFTINLQALIAPHWTEIFLILLQLCGALVIGLHATQWLHVRCTKQ
ncbi:cation-translocating P-type ATPase [Candidatus Similichlamydia laticola]|uniref:Lead, cadmium, zinc and mercury transporting ATPase n=1 Tax=Candidatus Similichlamydia laticola TaxID=2170265 RepID=A0A369KFE8_9BACT|nr:cation-translocating P-type ATPase [Candidatus Similichlamydia laticola]RDB31627.1 Lead, cadmium, zinc and mercury transporting ATPase [Candidatus Similichlamydia laticola]